MTACSAPPGYVSDNTDCDDTDASVHPGAPEICDSKDNNCNGQVDEDVQTTFYRDADHDGYGDPANPTQACSAPAGYVTDNTDCNDNDASVHSPQTYFRDADGDGFGDPNNPTAVCSSTPPSGYVTNSSDCDDSRPLYADNDGDGYGAGQPVACGVANNTDCNDADASVHSPQTYYRDADGDGFGDPNNATTVCSSTPPSGYVSNNSDCDDTQLLYADNDGDGYGVGQPVACGVANNTDCNDADASVHSPQTYYRDADGDGFGDPNNATTVCSSTPPTGYVTNSSDCNDTNAAIHPGATELCNGVDDNCDGQIDEGYRGQIQPPINADGTSVFTVRRGVVPVKFTLTQDCAPTCALPPATIAVTRTGGGTIGEISESVYTGSADSGSNFRINGCQYIYNLNSGALGVGTYRVDIRIDGQVVGSGVFQLK